MGVVAYAVEAIGERDSISEFYGDSFAFQYAPCNSFFGVPNGLSNVGKPR